MRWITRPFEAWPTPGRPRRRRVDAGDHRSVTMVSMSSPIEVPISDDVIRLGPFLKLAGLAESGTHVSGPQGKESAVVA